MNNQKNSRGSYGLNILFSRRRIIEISYSENDVLSLCNLIGQSVWHLQHLEHVLTTFSALKILQKERDKGAKVTEIVGQRVLEKQRGLTLGPLIASAKREETIPLNLMKRFESLLQERNWLILKCVINEFFALRSETRKQALFARISSFVDEAISLKTSVNEIMAKWFEAAGYDLDHVFRIAQESLREAERS